MNRIDVRCEDAADHAAPAECSRDRRATSRLPSQRKASMTSDDAGRDRQRRSAARRGSARTSRPGVHAFAAAADRLTRAVADAHRGLIAADEAAINPLSAAACAGACPRARNSSKPTSADDRRLRARGRSIPSSGSRGSLLDRVDQRRVDIGLAAHRGRVAERFGDRLDHRLDADPLGVLGLSSIARRRSRSRPRCGNAWR